MTEANNVVQPLSRGNWSVQSGVLDTSWVKTIQFDFVSKNLYLHLYEFIGAAAEFGGAQRLSMPSLEWIDQKDHPQLTFTMFNVDQPIYKQVFQKLKVVKHTVEYDQTNNAVLHKTEISYDSMKRKCCDLS